MYPLSCYRYKSTRPRCSWRVWRRLRLRLRPTRQRRLQTRTMAVAASRPASRIPSSARKRGAPRTSCQACTSCACAVTAKCSCRRRTASAPPTTRAWCAGERPVRTADTNTAVAVSVLVVRDRQVVNRTHYNIIIIRVILLLLLLYYK